jgi:PAS domain S-box-containing protein
MSALARPAPPPFDVVALVTSAGGLEALSAVLADLPTDFPAAVVVGQHLGAESTLPEILARRTGLGAAWAVEGARLAPGRIHVCPPHMRLEVLPDMSCSLAPIGRDVLAERPLDALLASVADSCGPRGMGIVLTGMGRDGAAGARALKAAGGAVLVQAQTDAAFPEMPRAAIDAGAADLVLPLAQMSRAVLDVMGGGRFPQPRNEAEACEALFGGPDGAREALRATDWGATPLGPVLGWPASLRAVVTAALHSRFPTCLFCGPEFVQVYNDAWTTVLGRHHAQAAGTPAAVGAPQLWASLGGPCRRVVQAGQSGFIENQLLEVRRHGFVEEAYFTISHSPVHDEQGRVQGVMTVAAETSERVLGERRLSMLRALAATGSGADTAAAACEKVAQVLAEAPRDLPFALVYVVDAGGVRATLCASAGLRAGSPAAPHAVDLYQAAAVWPLGRIVRQGTPLVLGDLGTRLRAFHAGPWAEPPARAMLLPLRIGQPEVGAVLVAGLSPRLVLDDAYRTFIEMAAQQVASNMAEARLREQDRERLARLAELDRAKTEFFSNVSHEFRTPLTLILAPLEDLLAARDEVSQPLRRELEIASRNAARLLGLVDTLLDFSQIEAGRLRARCEPVDLAALTRDIASLFRSAIERAGLRLLVDCPPLAQPVRVDRGMWERIVSNLLSNALKFTFDGTIAVRLRQLPQHAELEVSDSGVGIPAEELPRVFQRFHRVRGVRARTDEGAGIGLALVDELARLHHGRVRVRSVEGQGTTFSLWLPLNAPQRPGQADSDADGSQDHAVARQLAHEAGRWTEPAAHAPPPAEVAESMLGPATSQAAATLPGGRVLVVDDNADMRDYLVRTLGALWRVDAAADGRQALRLARELRPDLILADVMMPVLDGFGLLRELRTDGALKGTPVILVTARTHEQAAIEGLLAGAGDYIAKPFSSRELVARVGAQLQLARVRRQGERQVRELLGLMPVGVYACDRDGRFGYWNPRAIELWGATPQADDHHWALLGAPRVLTTAGEPLRPEDSPMGQVLRSGEPVHDRELILLRPDGTTVDILVNIRPIRDVGGAVAGAVSAFLDVTERKRAERSLQTLNEQLEQRVAERTAAVQASEAQLAADLAGMRRLYELNARLAGQDDLGAALQEIVAASNEFAGTDLGCIQLVSDDGQRLEMAASHGREPGDPLLRRFLHDACDAARRARSRVVIEDVARDPGLAGTPPAQAALAAGIHAAQATPMLSRAGELVGVLGNQFRHPHRPSQDQLRRIDLLAWLAAGLVERHKAAAALRVSEARHAYLLQLSDRLRAVEDPEQMQAIAAATLGEHLGADRVLYAQVLEEGEAEAIEVRQQYLRPGMAAFSDRLPTRVFSPRLLAELRAGHTVVVADLANEPRLEPGLLETYAGLLGIQAYLSVPLLRNGRLVAALTAHQAVARNWTAQDVALAQETAERTWAAVERARAEAEREAAREALASQSRFLDVTLSSMPDLVYAFDRRHRFAYTNPATQRLFARDAAGMLGRGFADLDLPPDLAARLDAHLDHVFATGQTVQDEVFYASPAGIAAYFAFVWAPVRGPDGAVELVVGVSRDMTERRRHESALRESEERFRGLVEGFGQTVWETDAQGRVVEDSPSWRALTGQSLQQWLGDGWADALHPEDRGPALAQWRETVAAGRKVNAEFRIQTRGGGWRWTNVRAVPLRGADGSVLKWVGMNIDIDDRKKAEARLLEREAQLRAFNAELQRFNSAMVGRELRMIELKRQIDELRGRLGLPRGFRVPHEEREGTDGGAAPD